MHVCDDDEYNIVLFVYEVSYLYILMLYLFGFHKTIIITYHYLITWKKLQEKLKNNTLLKNILFSTYAHHTYTANQYSHPQDF